MNKLSKALALVVAAFVLGACGTSAGSKTTAAGNDGLVHLTYGGTSGSQADLPFEVGQKLGIFAKHGIALTKVPQQHAESTIAALASGSIDVAVVAPTILGGAVLHGQQLAMFCGEITNTTFDLLVPPDSPLAGQPAPSDWKAALQALKGKKVGPPSTADQVAVMFQAAMTEAGVNPSDYVLVGAGSGAPGIAAFEHHQVDALIGYPFISEKLLGGGEAQRYLNLTEAVPSYQGVLAAAMASTTSWIKQHGKVAADLTAALQESMAAAADPKNKDLVNQIFTDYYGLQTDKARSTAFEVMPSFSTQLTPQIIDKTYATVQNGKILPASPKLTYDKVVLTPAA